MKRGEIWWVNFDPSIGGEIKKRRPAIIISNDAYNKYLNRVQVIPLTSNTERLYPSEAIVTFDNQESKAMADQITTVSKKRFIGLAGEITDEELSNVGKAIKVQLGFR